MSVVSVIQKDFKIFAAVTAVSVASMLVVLPLLFLPALKANFKLSGKLRAKKADLEKISGNIKNYGTMENDVKNLNAELKEKKEMLFWEMGIGGFLNEFTQMASGLPIEFVSITPQAPLNAGKQEESVQDALSSYKEVPISVELKGDYASLIKFLSKIEGADKSITVKKLDIASDAQNIFKHTIRMTLTIFSKTG